MRDSYQKTIHAGMGLAILMALAAGGCSGKGETKAAAEIQDKKIILVKLMEIKPQVFEQNLTLSASARPSKEVVVSSEVIGRVEKTAFEKGEYVKEGEPLLWLDAASMKAQRGQAVIDRDLARLDYEKQKALQERGGSVSSYTLERAKLIMDSADARVRGIETALAKYIINAPISGVAAGKEVETGSVTSPGMLITRILAVDPIKVVAGAPESAMADFTLGKKAQITIDAYPERKWEGKVTFIAPEVNKSARVVDIEISLPNPGRVILPEMAAKVSVARKAIAGAILAPQNAILELAGGHAVFVVGQDKVARQRVVEVSGYSAGQALIKAGLEVGDRLVILGQRELIDGDTVEIRE